MATTLPSRARVQDKGLVHFRSCIIIAQSGVLTNPTRDSAWVSELQSRFYNVVLNFCLRHPRFTCDRPNRPTTLQMNVINTGKAKAIVTHLRCLQIPNCLSGATRIHLFSIDSARKPNANINAKLTPTFLKPKLVVILSARVEAMTNEHCRGTESFQMCSANVETQVHCNLRRWRSPERLQLDENTPPTAHFPMPSASVKCRVRHVERISTVVELEPSKHALEYPRYGNHNVLEGRRV